MNTSAVDQSIYSRRVPGISNGELVHALHDDQRRVPNQANFNDAFSRTSPAVYHHYSGQQQNRQHRSDALANVSQRNGDDGGIPVDMAGRNAAETSERAVQRRIGALDASVREYHAKEIARHGQVIEKLQSMQYAINLRTWILGAFGVILLALMILILCMLSKYHSAVIGSTSESSDEAASDSNSANFLRTKRK